MGLRSADLRRGTAVARHRQRTVAPPHPGDEHHFECDEHDSDEANSAPVMQYSGSPGTGDRPADPEINRLVAAEPRITAAILGLIGSDWLTGIAARITIPVEFVLQLDDTRGVKKAGPVIGTGL